MPFVAPPPNAEYTDVVEAAFGYTRDVDSATWVWTDITKYVRGAITITKGRPDATSTADPCHIQLTLDNSDGRFTKGNPMSPYWPNVVRGVPLRVRRTWKNATTSYERATAFVGGWPVTPVAGVKYVETQIDAWGRLRQLRRDNTPVKSPLYRAIHAIGPTAHWALEDGPNSNVAASAVTGQRNMTVAGSVAFGQTGPVGAASAVDFSGGGQLKAALPTSTSGSFEVTFACQRTSTSSDCVPIRINTSGSFQYVILLAGGAQQVTVSLIDSAGSLVLAGIPFNNTLGNNVPPLDTAWHVYQLTVAQDGSFIDIGLVIDGKDPDTSIIPFSSLGAATVGRVTGVILNPGPYASATAAVSTFSLAAVGVLTPAAYTVDGSGVMVPNDAASIGQALIGHDGESATTRIARLGTENSVPVTTSAGTLGTPQPLGGQGVDTLGNLFDAAADADCGLLHDGGTLGALYYASPGARYNAATQLTVAYAQSQISDGLAGTDDDQTLTNDVTITRSGGSSGEWVNTTSATGEGRVTGQDTLNLHDDNQPDKVAQLRANLSSYDAMRFPAVPLDLRRNPELVQAWTSLTLPAYLAINGVPSPYPPNSIDQFIEGYTEVLDAVTWAVVANCSPAAPWRVGQLDDTTNPFRCDADWTSAGPVVSSQLVVNAGVSATATSFGLKTLSGPLVTTSAGDFPVLIEDATTGEVMRLTNVTGASSPQTATVVRSINGVVKALGTNDSIRLYRPAGLAL